MKNNKYISKIKITALIFALPLFMVVLFGPTEIYYANISDFTFLYKDFISNLLIVFIVVLCLASVVIALFPDSIFRFIIAFVTSISVTTYFQNIFLNSKIAERDGAMVRWAKLKTTMAINTIIWLLILIIIMVLIYIIKWRKANCIKICVTISSFLLLIQFVSFSMVVFNIEKRGDNFNQYLLDSTELYTLGNDNNIIVLCLDSTDSKTMKELYLENKEELSFLDDFTLYTNYDSKYSPTFPSVSHLLTGMDPDAEGQEIEWNEKAWNSKRANYFYDRLHNNGYKVKLYAMNQKYVFGEIENLKNKVDNVVYSTPNIDRNRELLSVMMAKMSLYRYVPYVAKPRFEVNMDYYKEATFYTEDDYNEGNYEVYARLAKEGIKLDNNQSNMFIYQHMRGIHKPYDIDKEGNKIWDEDKNKKDVLYGITNFLGLYINEMKELGVYDKATIIILADHTQEYIAPQMSLFMIKLPNQKFGEMQFSEAPICSDDFQATILSLLDEDYNEYGTSIFDWNDGDSRERWTYYRYKGIFGFSYTGNGDDMEEAYKKGYTYEKENPNW